MTLGWRHASETRLGPSKRLPRLMEPRGRFNEICQIRASGVNHVVAQRVPQNEGKPSVSAARPNGTAQPVQTTSVFQLPQARPRSAGIGRSVKNTSILASEVIRAGALRANLVWSDTR